jgi:F0F1-type ATP synthase assembly protein I
MNRRINRKVAIGILAVSVIVAIALFVKGLISHAISSIGGGLFLMLINCLTLTDDVFGKEKEEISAS